MDAASRTKVDDTRELLDNVQYAPARGRYKVYLIDEVHMLSTHSFNALLKTLEEPPPHVKFLLATTDPQKLPVTVLSRCLQFNLRRLPLPLIDERLAQIATAENVEFEPAALRAIARAAEGSMRDALSLLDQVLAFGGGRALEAEVRALLGTLDRRHVEAILGALAAQRRRDAHAVRGSSSTSAPRTTTRRSVNSRRAIQRMALLQALPDLPRRGRGSRTPALAALAAQFAPEDLQLLYQIAITARRDLDFAPDARGGLRDGAAAHAGVPAASRSRRSAAPAAGRSGGSRAHRGARGGAGRLAGLRCRRRRRPLPRSRRRSHGSGRPRRLGRRSIEALGLQGPARQLAAHCVLVERRQRCRASCGSTAAGEPSSRPQTRAEAGRRRCREHCGEPVRLEIGVGARPPADRGRRPRGSRRWRPTSA